MNRSIESYKQDLLILTDSLYYSDLILEECIQLAYSTSNNLDFYYDFACNQLKFGIHSANVLQFLQSTTKNNIKFL